MVATAAAALYDHQLPLRASGADRVAAQKVATDLIRLFIPQIAFYGLTALLSAMLNARRRFLAAAYAPVLNNVVAIALFLVLPHVVTGGGLTIERGAPIGPLVLIPGTGTPPRIVRM